MLVVFSASQPLAILWSTTPITHRKDWGVDVCGHVQFFVVVGCCGHVQRFLVGDGGLNSCSLGPHAYMASTLTYQAISPATQHVLFK